MPTERGGELRGRWHVAVELDGSPQRLVEEGAVVKRTWTVVPVVPCDETAVERAAKALYELWISKLPTGSQFFEFDEMAEDLREEAIVALRAAAGEQADG